MTLKHPEYAHGISDADLIKEAIEFCDEELDGYEGMEYDDDSEVCCQRSNTFIRELVRRLEARSALALPLPVQESAPVAWMHPTANWSHVNYQAIRIHCRNDGPMPIPLYLHPETASVREGWRLIGYIGKSSLALLQAGELSGCALTADPPKVESVPLYADPSIPEEKGGTAESVKPISLETLRGYFKAMDAGDVPDQALALYSYLLMDGFISRRMSK